MPMKLFYSPIHDFIHKSVVVAEVLRAQGRDSGAVTSELPAVDFVAPESASPDRTSRH